MPFFCGSADGVNIGTRVMLADTGRDHDVHGAGHHGLCCKYGACCEAALAIERGAGTASGSLDAREDRVACSTLVDCSPAPRSP